MSFSSDGPMDEAAAVRARKARSVLGMKKAMKAAKNARDAAKAMAKKVGRLHAKPARSMCTDFAHAGRI